MKEKFERFKNEKTVINVRSQKQYDDFMKMCQEQGLKWSGGSLPTKYNIYNDWEEETCINLNNLRILSYTDIDFYKNEGYGIITYEDFIKEESNQFTKSDLKENHIVKLQNGDYVVMKQLCDVNDITNSLEHKRYKEWQINEVYKFGELLWKREESILDEVEKKYLSDVIRPFKNEITWIKKDTFRDNSDEEWIDIETNESGMIFPEFKKGTMYKGMELKKEYTLKELGLE